MAHKMYCWFLFILCLLKSIWARGLNCTPIHYLNPFKQRWLKGQSKNKWSEVSSAAAHRGQRSSSITSMSFSLLLVFNFLLVIIQQKKRAFRNRELVPNRKVPTDLLSLVKMAHVYILNGIGVCRKPIV